MNAPYVAEWHEYAALNAREAKAAAKVPCSSCDGFGDHGVEPETGCLYVCYGCYGTGWEPAAVAA